MDGVSDRFINFHAHSLLCIAKSVDEMDGIVDDYSRTDTENYCCGDSDGVFIEGPNPEAANDWNDRCQKQYPPDACALEIEGQSYASREDREK